MALTAPSPAAQAQAPAPTTSPTVTPTATPPPLLFDDSDTFLTYSGLWATVQDAKARGGTLHQAREPQARMRFRFNGPYFKWYAVRGPNRGQARVSVDGVEVKGSPFDLYKAGDPAYDLIIWQGGLDSAQPHTLVIEA
ncbi:MAG TPA: hypothetical protein VNK05_15550, partial [Chloroflexota bacterium]|nr:hypothetical protein [Chloroflexota bacterium]